MFCLFKTDKIINMDDVSYVEGVNILETLIVLVHMKNGKVVEIKYENVGEKLKDWDKFYKSIER